MEGVDKIVAVGTAAAAGTVAVLLPRAMLLLLMSCWRCRAAADEGVTRAVAGAVARAAAGADRVRTGVILEAEVDALMSIFSGC